MRGVGFEPTDPWETGSLMKILSPASPKSLKLIWPGSTTPALISFSSVNWYIYYKFLNLNLWPCIGIQKSQSLQRPTNNSKNHTKTTQLSKRYSSQTPYQLSWQTRYWQLCELSDIFTHLFHYSVVMNIKEYFTSYKTNSGKYNSYLPSV